MEPMMQKTRMTPDCCYYCGQLQRNVRKLTWFFSSPILALHELVSIARDQRGIEGGHFID
jgi:hypothetical protein